MAVQVLGCAVLQYIGAAMDGVYCAELVAFWCPSPSWAGTAAPLAPGLHRSIVGLAGLWFCRQTDLLECSARAHGVGAGCVKHAWAGCGVQRAPSLPRGGAHRQPAGLRGAVGPRGGGAAPAVPHRPPHRCQRGLVRAALLRGELPQPAWTEPAVCWGLVPLWRE